MLYSGALPGLTLPGLISQAQPQGAATVYEQQYRNPLRSFVPERPEAQPAGSALLPGTGNNWRALGWRPVRCSELSDIPFSISLARSLLRKI